MATVTNVASAAADTAILAAGPRSAVLLCNSDANDAYVLFDGGAAAVSNMSVLLVAKQSISVPRQFVNGPIRARWASAGSGYMHATTF